MPRLTSPRLIPRVQSLPQTSPKLWSKLRDHARQPRSDCNGYLTNGFTNDIYYECNRVPFESRSSALRGSGLLTLAFATLPKTRPVTPFPATLAKLSFRNPFVCHTSTKNGGGTPQPGRSPRSAISQSHSFLSLVDTPFATALDSWDCKRPQGVERIWTPLLPCATVSLPCPDTATPQPKEVTHEISHVLP